MERETRSRVRPKSACHTSARRRQATDVVNKLKGPTINGPEPQATPTTQLKNMAGWKFHHKSAAYAATALGASMMNSVFSYYYVKVFLNRYKVSEPWFHVAQIIYMIWNAVNDPLFGYMQDNLNFSWVRSRRHSILYGAPLYGLAFIIPWFPWGQPGEIINGIHLIVTLCFFDALLTFVLLAQCSLFAELSKKHEDRVKLVQYSQIASLIGSSSIFFCEWISHNLEQFFNFQVTCVVIAVLGFLCIRYTGLHSQTMYDEQSISNVQRNSSTTDNTEESGCGQIIKQTWQIMKYRDFLSFVFMNFCQVYHITFLAGFAIIFCDQLVSKDLISSFTRSFFYGSFSFASQILVIMLVPMVRRLGYYRIVRGSFIMKVLLGAMLWYMGPNPWNLLIFFLLDSAGSNAAFSLFNLCLSDIIDQDKERHNRNHPLSSMVFGTNALITKPANSFAPMITVAILNMYGYESIKSGATEDPASRDSLHSVMFNIAVMTSIVLGVLQLAIWSRYQLRTSHETMSKYVEDA